MLPAYHFVNGYTMTEFQSVFTDNWLYNHVKGISEPRYKLSPPWTRWLAVDADTLEPLPKGETGLPRLFTLANFNTVQAVQTDDLGVQIGSGFECVGRAKGAEARGCSVAMDELL